MTVLRHRAFRRLVTGLAASQLGDWVYNVALLAYVFERTHSTGWLGVTTAARVLPLVASARSAASWPTAPTGAG